MKKLTIALIIIFSLSGCVTYSGIEDGILDCNNNSGATRCSEPWYTGQATKVYSNGDKYVGDYLNGRRHGSGVLTRSDGSAFEGEFKMNSPKGKGKRTDVSGYTAEANFSGYDLKFNLLLAPGPCLFTTDKGLKWYEGECTGAKSGEAFRGKKRYENGTVYIGDFKVWTPHGKGKLLNSDGEVLKEGIWENEIFYMSPKNTCRDYGFKDDTDGMGLCLIELNKLAELERQTEILKNSSNNQAMRNNANAAIYAKELADRKRQREAQALMNLGAIIGGIGSPNSTNNKTKGSSSAIKWEDNYSSTLNVPSNQVCPITGSPLVKQERRGINKICYYQ